MTVEGTQVQYILFLNEVVFTPHDQTFVKCSNVTYEFPVTVGVGLQ